MDDRKPRWSWKLTIMAARIQKYGTATNPRMSRDAQRAEVVLPKASAEGLSVVHSLGGLGLGGGPRKSRAWDPRGGS